MWYAVQIFGDRDRDRRLWSLFFAAVCSGPKWRRATWL
jgi:hypothetical protein